MDTLQIQKLREVNSINSKVDHDVMNEVSNTNLYLHEPLHKKQVEEAPFDISLSCRGLLHQTLTAGAADLSALGLGLVFGYSAVALPQLEHRDSWLVIDKEQASWIASLVGLSLSVGCVLAGVLMERWGRRTTLQLQCVPSALGWILIASANSVPQLYVGRLLTGLGGGMIDSACQVYLSEISNPRVRGAIGASNPLCFTFGVLLAYILGCWRLPWPILAAASTAFPVLAFIALCFVPESPVWLSARGKRVEAKRALLWLNGCTDDSCISDEVLRHDRIKPKDVLRSLISRHTIRPIVILLIFFVFQQFCGMNAVVFYAVTMFQSSETNGTNAESTSGLDSNQSAVVIGLTRFIMTAVTCALLARVGRRPLSIVSGIGMTTAMFSLGTAIYMQTDSSTEGPDPRIILPCLMLFIASNTLGFFALPWVMLGELLPEKCRGLASGLVSAIVYTFVFIVVKTYPLLLDVLGEAGVFYAYGTIACIGLVFVLLVLPETHGKSLEEIESSFRKT